MSLLSLGDKRADWLDLPDPGFRESWNKRKEIFSDLMDGAYFGLNGDSVLDLQERIFLAPTGSIVVHNPGIKKKSYFIPDIFAGRILSTLNNNGVPGESVTFPEAENEGWIKEKIYLDAWRYLGKNTMTVWNRIRLAQGYIPDTVYQVTKKGVGKICVTERDIQRPNIFYFFGLRPRI